MIIPLLIALQAVASANSQPATKIVSAYRDCVRDDAFKLIRSQDAAETLVKAGEYNCSRMLDDYLNAYRVELNRDPEFRRTATRFPDQVKDMLRKHQDDVRSMVHDSVLHDVLIFKAGINEAER